ncbi:hypothetical protein [Thermoactinomyces sp. DSM 45892]|uniref:hypothetical protein n=1 Tax=Thermoactinomyces sp. DSM 45892 TaxID=1882753 RepID=UPI00159FFD33|nr:hypothetical protein [Thermoactinomyces sp. DSM 45892]
MIRKAVEKEQEERAWQFWISIYPHADQDRFPSFEQFLSKIQRGDSQKRHSPMTAEIAIAKAEAIKRVHQRKEE